jgi:hypothetical protein
LPAVSSTISSTFRPAIWCPASSRYISNPFTVSRPTWAAPPVSGARKPILIGFFGCAAAGDHTHTEMAATARTAPRTRTLEKARDVRMSIPPLGRSVRRDAGQ